MPLLSTTVLTIVDAVATVFTQAYQEARIRAAQCPSASLRRLAQVDNLTFELTLVRRENAVLRGGRANGPPLQRPDYTPAQRLEILQIMRLRGWSIARAAEHFVVHPNTIRSWIKALEGNGTASLLSGAVVWNRIDDAVRWAIHELRQLCPQPEFGTRTVARLLLRAGIDLHRSTVQRILREPKPEEPRPKKPPMEEPAGADPYDLLTPTQPNHVWHMDMVQIKLLGIFHFMVAVILDGFSRKILAAKVYAKTPRSRNLTALLRATAAKHGKPQFLITDHGCQFRRKFHAGMKALGIRHVRGKVRAPFLNGKCERFFRTFRIWWCLVLCGRSAASVQRRINNYVSWYNDKRPHSALGVLTPNEAWDRQAAPTPVPIRARDPQKFNIEIARQRCRGDPRLPVIQITVRKAA